MTTFCTTRAVNEYVVRSVQAPEGTETWVPIPHYELLDTVQEVMDKQGLVVDPTSKQFGLKRDNNQMFAVLKVVNEVDVDFGLSIGIRNSTDKSLSAAICFGSHVFVCDNLVFSGEIVLARKHTKYIRDDLDSLIVDALGKVSVFRTFHENMYTALQGIGVTDMMVHDLVCRAFREDAIPVSHIARILDEWDKPSHPEFKPRTAWSLFNAFTEVAKTGFARNPQMASQRTMRLTGLMQRVFTPELTCDPKGA